jgi:hypothetical protein
MRSDRYFHPEFGWFAPSSRLRRELQIRFFSLLVGLGTGVAAVTAVSTGPHERDSGSVASVQDGIAKPLPGTEPYKRVEIPSRTAAVGHDNENPAMQPGASAARDNSDRDRKVCQEGDLACVDERRPRTKPRNVDLAPIGRVPLGRSDGLTPSGAWAGIPPHLSKPGPSNTAGETIWQDNSAVDQANSTSLPRRNLNKSARSQNAGRNAPEHEGSHPARVSHGSARNSISPKSFWAWSW